MFTKRKYEKLSVYGIVVCVQFPSSNCNHELSCLYQSTRIHSAVMSVGKRIPPLSLSPTNSVSIPKASTLTAAMSIIKQSTNDERCYTNNEHRSGRQAVNERRAVLHEQRTSVWQTSSQRSTSGVTRTTNIGLADKQSTNDERCYTNNEHRSGRQAVNE